MRLLQRPRVRGIRHTRPTFPASCPHSHASHVPRAVHTRKRHLPVRINCATHTSCAARAVYDCDTPSECNYTHAKIADCSNFAD